MKGDTQSHGQHKQTGSEFPMTNHAQEVKRILEARHAAHGHAKSLSEILKEKIGGENEAALERLYAKVTDTLQSGVDYVNENPQDSKFVAAVGELAAWIKKQAQPGLEAIEDAAKAYLPKVEAWMAETLQKSNSTSTATKH